MVKWMEVNNMNGFTVGMDCPVCYKRDIKDLKTMSRKNPDELFLCWICGSRLTEVQINEMWIEIKK